MTTATTVTFYSFPHLPSELRTRIWELTFEPRVVEVRVVHYRPQPLQVSEQPGMDKRLLLVRYLRSSTTAPAQLQTCREAREHLTRHPDIGYRYEKAFSEIATISYDGFDPVSEGDPERERYVWLNFDYDIVSIGETDMSEFRAVAYQVRRLRLERSLWDEYFSRTESLFFYSLFRNIREIHMICKDGIRTGFEEAEVLNTPCGPENVYFGEPEEMGGKLMNSVDLDAIMLEEYGGWPDESGEEG